AGCNSKGCTVAGTLLECDLGNSCASPVCAPGLANCDNTNPDCETRFDSAASSCFPRYLGTISEGLLTGEALPVAIGLDGSYYLGGSFSEIVDFDPGPGTDVHNPEALEGFISKFNPDGSYAWTKTFGSGMSQASVDGLAVTSDGSIVLTGWHGGAIDLDP